MQGTKIPFGERQGMLFRAFEVENGLACGCICPGCHKPLNAANGGQKVIPHFRYVHSENCVSGFKDGVRRAAVALIAAQRSLTLPSFHCQISAMTDSGRILSREVSVPETSAAAERVERFVDLGDVTAHAILTTGNHQLLVRIKVFSRSEKKRYERLSNIEASSVEIDLSELNLGQISDPLAFERAVMSDPTTRSWIRSLRGERRIKRAEAGLARSYNRFYRPAKRRTSVLDILVEVIFRAICFPIGWPIVRLITLGKHPSKGSWFAYTPEAQCTSAAGARRSGDRNNGSHETVHFSVAHQQHRSPGVITGRLPHSNYQ